MAKANPIRLREYKRSLISRIRKLIKPHLCPGGYVDHRTKEPIPLYAPAEADAWDARYLASSLQGGPDAVTDTGFVDAFGHGMVETPFEDVPVEDLETFLDLLGKFDFKANARK